MRIFLLIALLISAPVFSECESNDSAQVDVTEERNTPPIRNKIYEAIKKAENEIAKNKLDQAEKRVRKLIDKNDLNGYEIGNVYNTLAYIQYVRADYEAAIELYELVVEQSPQIPLDMELESLRTISQFHFLKEQWQQGIDAYGVYCQKGAKLSVNDNVLLANAYHQIGKYEQSLEHIDIAIKTVMDDGLLPKPQWSNLQQLLRQKLNYIPKWASESITAIERYSNNISSRDVVRAIEKTERNPSLKKGRFETADEFRKRAASATRSYMISAYATRAVTYGKVIPDSSDIFFNISKTNVTLKETTSSETIEGQNSYGANCQQEILTVLEYEAQLINRERDDSTYLGISRAYLSELDPEINEITIFQANPSDPSTIERERIDGQPTCSDKGVRLTRKVIDATIFHQALIDAKTGQILAVVAPDGKRFYDPLEKSVENLIGIPRGNEETLELAN